MSQFDDESHGSWKESISDLSYRPLWWSWNESVSDLPYSLLWWSWKESLVTICEGSWNESMCTSFLNSSKLSVAARYEGSWNESICTNFLNPSELAAASWYEGSWNESICTNSLISPKWSWKGSVCLQHYLLPWFWLSSSFCTVMYCFTCGFSTSALAAWGTFSWAPWWTLFCALWGSLLCPWGLPGLLGSHGLHGRLSSSVLHGDLSYVRGGLPGLLGVTGVVYPTWLPGSVLLELDLSGCASLAHCESFSPFTADFLSEMKLKASFSAMSQFAVLALIKLSKVLKEINLLFFLALTHCWKVLKWIGLLLVPSMVLKEVEVALLTLCSMSWKETFSSQTYPWSWKKSFCLYFWLCHWLCWHHPLLWWHLCHLHQGSWKELTHVCLAHFCLVCWLGSWQESQCTSLWWLLCHLHQRSWKESTCICFALFCLVCWLGSWKESQSGAHSHGLERTEWMVLKGFWCNSLVPQWCFAIYFQARVLKGISGVGICLVFYNRLGNIFT